MKIVQLSTSDMGGAGIAAKQLHIQLLNHNIESTFITKIKLGQTILNHQTIKIETEKGIYYRVTQRIKNTIKYQFPIFDNNLNYYLQNKKEGFEHFSFPFSDISLENIQAIKNADIIHLHWVADQFIDYKDIFSLNKKFVWTLHDMNPFTGGCHHSDGCEKFKSNCNYCFQLEGTPDEYLSNKILNYKIEALKLIKDEQLKIIAPSKWLLNLSQSSKCFSRFEHTLVPNIIEIKSSNKTSAECKQKLKIEENKIVFLFVAHNVNNVRKGIFLLNEALTNLPNKENITLLTIGEKSGIKFNNIKTIELGFINDKSIIEEAYLAADAFLLPSIAENYPNTVIEALLSGTPVIASNVGGIPEQITNNNGILAYPNNVKSWVDALLFFINNIQKYDRQKIASDAKLIYNVDLITQKHIQIYNKLVN